VLDDWKGIVGSSDANANSGTSTSGIFFNIVMLRVLNSTGSNVPIQPTFFNDMYNNIACTPTGYLATHQNTCIPSTTLQNVKNSDWCTVNEQTGQACSIAPISGSCTFSSLGSAIAGSFTGGGVNYAEYQCISTGSLSSNYTSLATGSGSYNKNVYPPYGWVISANITGVSNGAVGQSYSLCSSFSCTKNPTQLLGGANSYLEGYAPVGPQLRAVGSCSIIGECNAFETIYSPGFSVNYNNTAVILFPNSTNSNSAHGTDEGLDNWGEILIANINWQNYTNLFSGITNYTCYVKGEENGNQNVCGGKFVNDHYYYTYNSLVDSFTAPIYLLGDPFKYYENLGTSPVLGFANQFYSTYNNGNQGSGSGSPQSQISSQCTQQVQSGSIPTACLGASGTPPTPSLSGLSLGTTTGQLAVPILSTPLLQSSVSGVVLVPYTYSGTLVQNWRDFQLLFGGYGCPGSLPDWPTVTTNKIEYTYQEVPVSSKPTPLAANIEGGDTYIGYRDALGSDIYMPNLSDFGVSLPPQVLFNVSSNRVFGNIYINLTNNKTTNKQTLLNATERLEYVVNTYSIGQYMKFQSISSVPVGPYYGTQYAARLQNKPSTNIATGLNYTQLPSGGSGFVYLNLFNIYKQFVWQSPLNLYINSTAQGLPYGYRRLIYVYQDRFNNTIFMPLDADIAKFTVINMSVIPSINPTNANQTTLQINGTVGYYQFSNSGLVFEPLTGNSLYLYYNTNLNYIDYPPTTDAFHATACAFGSPVNKFIQTLTCNLANPINSPQSATANIVTYSPQYNAQGACNPANVLLPPVNYNCNVYNSGKQCSTGPDGQREYCVGLDSQGDGICTSQVGLIGVVPTNALGYFSTNIVACGIADVNIQANFYGSPPPEPVNATQAPLGMAANVAIPDTGVPLPGTNFQHPTQITFPVDNYTWLNNDTIVQAQIGLWELAYGDIQTLEVIGLISLVGAVIAAKLILESRSKTRRKSVKNRIRKPERTSHRNRRNNK
jgi:hypothetical protein